jgi:arylsulfatase A-like enzyme
MLDCKTINRRDFIRLGAGALAAGSVLGAPVAARQKKPNIVIFFTDDQGIGDISAFESEDFQTPNMDRLAQSGVRFTNWYSSSPVCSPSRASLLTGRYPQRTGVSRILQAGRSSPGLFGDERTLATILREQGYRTGAFGKWHLGSSPESRPNNQGFDDWYGFLAGCVDYYSHIMYWEMRGGSGASHDLWKNNEEVWENGTYLTDIITRESVRFIRQNKDQPFCLYVPYNSPHYPMHAPKKYFDRFKHLEWHRRHQAAMVATVDDSMGAIMDELESQGLTDNTVIFFQSDNGATIERRCLHDGSGEHYHGGSNGDFRGWKGGLYEGGIRMPAVLSWPGHIQQNTTCSEMGHAIDILPTLLGIAGIPIPDDRVIDGKDILPMARGETTTPHEKIFWKIREQLAMREGRWKFILSGRESFEKDESLPPVFLADLEADPGETTNLAEAKPELVAQLKETLLAWDKDVQSRR